MYPVTISHCFAIHKQDFGSSKRQWQSNVSSARQLSIIIKYSREIYSYYDIYESGTMNNTVHKVLREEIKEHRVFKLNQSVMHSRVLFTRGHVLHNTTFSVSNYIKCSYWAASFPQGCRNFKVGGVEGYKHPLKPLLHFPQRVWIH